VIAKDGVSMMSLNASIVKDLQGFSYNLGTNEGVTTLSNTGAVPDNVLKYFIGVSGGKIGTLTISGLDPALTYTIKTLSNGRALWNGSNYNVNVNVQGSSQLQNFSPSGGNTSAFLEWNNVSPDALGKIVVTVTQGTGSPAGPLNAVIVAKELSSGLRKGIYISDTEADLIYVYPNPANTQLTIKADSEEEVKVQVINLLGAIMNTPVTNTHPGLVQLNIGELEPGVYMVEIDHSGLKKIRKIVIAR
jgi:hypothetical protein